MTVEAIKAAKILKKIGVSVEIIDLLSIKPLDMRPIHKSLKKTGRLIVLDTSHPICSVASEVISQVVENSFSFLRSKPVKLNLPDSPEPTSYSLSKNYYNNFEHIVYEVLKIMKLKNKLKTKNLLFIEKNKHHDVPGKWFKGPF